MYKSWHYWVRSVVVLSCISCLLFSAPLDVKASDSVDNITDIVNFTAPIYDSGSNFTYMKLYYAETYDTVWQKPKEKNITISPTIDTSIISVNPYETYCVYMTTTGQGITVDYISNHGATNVRVNRSTVYADTLKYLTFEGSPLSELQGSSPNIYRGYCLVQGIDLLNGFTSSQNAVCNFNCKVSFVIDFNASGSLYYDDYWKIKLPYQLTIYPLREGYQYMNTTDMETKRQIQQSEQVINSTLEEGNDIASDTNTTTHSIFDSISSFFGSFFSNLVGVFVPEDGFFTTWFNNLNTLLTNKLGILYYPFSVFIDVCNRLVTAVAGNQPNDPVIYFPELKIRIQNVDYVFVQAQEVHLSSYAINIQNADTSNSPMFGLNNLIHVIRRFTDIILTLCMFSLLRKKVNLILRGDDHDN